MALDPKLIRVALGKENADIVVKNGLLINVASGEIYPADIAIKGERIASIGPLPEGTIGPDTKVIDAKGMYLAPGFSKMVVARGTTAVASDLMEVTIVSGIEGMRELLAESKHAPVRLYYPVPSFMEEETGLQTIGSVLHASAIEELLQLPEAVGLAEVLGMPVLAESPQSAAVLELAEKRRLTAEGHAPGLTGAALNAYASAGIRSDHESTNAEEALQKLRAGLRVLMREGSASTDLLACIEIVVKNGVDTRHIAMVSDDIDALHIKRFGHMDHKVRMAIRAGVKPVQAIQMVTINPAESLKIDHEAGSIAPGRYADIVFLSSLEECAVEKVIAKGVLAAEDGVLTRDYPAPAYSGLLLNTVRLKKPVTAEDLAVKAPEGAKAARAWVIGASGTTLLTKRMEAELPVEGGVVCPDTNRDILHIACVERYGKNGGIGKSFIHGVGLKEGAVALSVGHDHHNITAVGANRNDMALAVSRMRELDGGIVFVRNGIVAAEIALPVCGLLSTEPGEAVAEKLEKLIAAMDASGSALSSPNVTLSFITLIFIPELAITDQGLFDVTRFQLIEPLIEE
jgi:adenine deaminase